VYTHLRSRCDHTKGVQVLAYKHRSWDPDKSQDRCSASELDKIWTDFLLLPVTNTEEIKPLVKTNKKKEQQYLAEVQFGMFQCMVVSSRPWELFLSIPAFRAGNLL
jgi:hypothetical protein